MTDAIDAAILVTALLASLLIVGFRSYHSSPLSKYPAYPVFASVSNLPYIALDTFNPRGPTPSLDKAHERLGPVIRTGPNRLHIVKASERVLRSLGRYDKAPTYAAFDFGGHQTLFSERKKLSHVARGNLSKCFSIPRIEEKKQMIEKHVTRTITLIRHRTKCTGGAINLMGIMQAFGLDLASEFLFNHPFGALDELQESKERQLPSIGVFSYTLDSILSLLFASTVLPPVGWFHWLYQKLTHRRSNKELADIDKVFTYSRQTAERFTDGKEESEYLFLLLSSQYYRDKDEAELRSALSAEIVDVLFAGGETIGTAMSEGLIELYGVESDIVERIRADKHDGGDLVKTVVKRFLQFADVNPRAFDRVIGERGLQLDDGSVMPPGVIIGVSPSSYRQPLIRPAEGSETFGATEEDDSLHIEFGYPGARSCVAKTLARLEMQAMTKAFVNAFDIVNAEQTTNIPGKDCEAMLRSTGVVHVKQI